MTTKTLTKADLRQFTGTEQWYRHWIKTLIYTEGIKYVADTVGAYWFLDIVATEHVPLLKQNPLLEIILTVADDETAVITAGDGDTPPIWTRKLDYTDFPAGTWKFYLADSGDANVLLLPSEY